MTYPIERPECRLNTKTPSYQYRNSHYKNMKGWQPFYLYNGRPHTWKDGLYIETGTRLPANVIMFGLTMLCSIFSLHRCWMWHMVLVIWFDPLWPNDTIWRRRFGSTLVQVMTTSLMAPSHYLKRYWPVISDVLWHAHKSDFTVNENHT